LRASGSKLNSLLPFNFYHLPEVLKSLILSHAEYKSKFRIAGPRTRLLDILQVQQYFPF
jgi:hypothetical protein